MLRHSRHPLEAHCNDAIRQTSTEAYKGMLEWDERLQAQKAQKCLQRLHGMRRTVQGLIASIDNLIVLCELDDRFFGTDETRKMQEYLTMLHKYENDPTSIQQAVAVVIAVTYERMIGWSKQFGHKVWRQPPLSENREDVSFAQSMSDTLALQQFSKLVQQIEESGVHLHA